MPIELTNPVVAAVPQAIPGAASGGATEAVGTIPVGSNPNLHGSPDQHALACLRALPGELTMAIVRYLDGPSRRRFACVDWQARALLAPQRRFDTLSTGVRWAASAPSMEHLLSEIATEPLPARTKLLVAFFRRLGEIGEAVPHALVLAAVAQVEALPVSLRAKPLEAMILATSRMDSHPTTLDRRVLSLTLAIPQPGRGPLLLRCLQLLSPLALLHAGILPWWLEVAGGLSAQHAASVAIMAIKLAVQTGSFTVDAVPAILALTQGLKNDAGMPSSHRVRILLELLWTIFGEDGTLPLVSMQEKTQLWHALLDAAVDGLGVSMRNAYLLGRLRRMVEGPATLPAETAAACLARVDRILANSRKEIQVVALAATAFWGDESEAQLRAQASQCLEQVAGLGPAMQADLYAFAPWLFLPRYWREGMVVFLTQIDALEPAGLRVPVLRELSHRMSSVVDAHGWERLVASAARLSENDRAVVLADSVSPDSGVAPHFDSLLQQASWLSPAIAAGLLCKLVPHIAAKAEPDMQEACLRQLLERVTALPPLHCASVLPALVRLTDALRFDGGPLLEPLFEATIAALPMARYAALVADIAGEDLGLKARLWVLRQIGRLADAQARFAVAGQPVAPYCAEVLRRLLTGMVVPDENKPAGALEPIWPSLSKVLSRTKEDAGDFLLDALRGMLPYLTGRLSSRVSIQIERLSQSRRPPSHGAPSQAEHPVWE